MAQQPGEVKAPAPVPKAPVPAPKAEIPEVVLNDFRRILGFAPGEKIPEALEEIYRRYAKRVDICSAGKITTKELILLTLRLP